MRPTLYKIYWKQNLMTILKRPFRVDMVRCQPIWWERHTAVRTNYRLTGNLQRSSVFWWVQFYLSRQTSQWPRFNQSHSASWFTYQATDCTLARKREWTQLWPTPWAFSPQVSYTDWATAAAGEELPTFVDRGRCEVSETDPLRSLISVF
jgi:hypothetical protein